MKEYKRMIGILITILAVPVLLLGLGSLVSVVMVIMETGFGIDALFSTNLLASVVCLAAFRYLLTISDEMLPKEI